VRIIGYFDAKSQEELPLSQIPPRNLTDVVLTGAVKVDKEGTLHYYEPPVAPTPSGQEPAPRHSMHTEDLIAALAGQSEQRLIVSLRGHPDDVALDELSENDTVRERFAADFAALLQIWGADGAEIEWHADDPAGGKAVTEPFDAPEQYHLALLCRDLAKAFRGSGGARRTLSVAVRPGRKELVEAQFVQEFIDWLTVRAYSMRSLGDPHHASLKDMELALGEWTALGVPPGKLVLGIPMFGRPGATLHSAGDRNEALRRSWRDLVSPASSSSHTRRDASGDVFVDAGTGKAWWASGLSTTRAKAKHVVNGKYAGIAFRDLHQDAHSSTGLSLLSAAAEAMAEATATSALATGTAMRRTRLLAKPMSLFQQGARLSKTDGGDRQDAGPRVEF